MGATAIDLTGQRFGRLIVIKRVARFMERKMSETKWAAVNRGETEMTRSIGRTRIVYSRTGQSPSGHEYASHNIRPYPSKWRVVTRDGQVIREDLVEANCSRVPARIRLQWSD